MSFSFGKQSFFHFAQWIIRFGRFELHQNCAMTLARCSHIANGSKKLDITYVGRASKIDFIKTFFPLFDSHLHVHPFIRCTNLSLRKAKSLHLDPLMSSWIPRYVPIPPSFWILSVFLICCLTVPLILLPKSIEDFSKLIRWPDACPYFLTTFNTSSHSWDSNLQKKWLSSAKRRWDTKGHVCVTRIPVIFLWFSAWLRKLTSTRRGLSLVYKINLNTVLYCLYT